MGEVGEWALTKLNHPPILMYALFGRGAPIAARLVDVGADI